MLLFVLRWSFETTLHMTTILDGQVTVLRASLTATLAENDHHSRTLQASLSQSRDTGRRAAEHPFMGEEADVYVHKTL